MNKKKSVIKLIRLYLQKIKKLLQRFLTRLSVGIVAGFIVGVALLVIIQKDVSQAVMFMAAAFAGVFAEIFIRFSENLINSRIELRPLNQVLGNISSEDTWIYISAWRRDLDDLKHFQLYRNDPEKRDQPLIVGSKYVYGKGDAIALSYITKAIEKATRGKTQIIVEDSERTFDEWNKNSICIGAHNSKTREILDKFKNTFYKFAMDYRIIVEDKAKIYTNEDGVQFIDAIKQTKAKDSSDIDYAILLKLDDEYHPEKNIILIAGLGDNGTAGAAYFLLTHPEELPYGDENFGVIIQVPSGPQSAKRVKFSDVARSTVIHVPEGAKND